MFDYLKCLIIASFITTIFYFDFWKIRKKTTKKHFQVEPRDILDYGVIPELAGRIPVVVTLDSLTQVTASFIR